MPERKQHDHCSYCGLAYPYGAQWPRKCLGCGETTWRNPLPCAVVIQPVLLERGGTGVVLVRRGIEPEIGKLALPGGYVDFGENWDEGGARELKEEVGIIVQPASLRLFRIRKSTHGRVMMIFGIGPPIAEADLPPFVANEEVTERRIVTAPVKLAFLTHTEALCDWFTDAQE